MDWPVQLGLRRGRAELNEARTKLGLPPVSRLHGGLPTDRCIAEWWVSSPRAEAVIDATSRDLLALLLGRPLHAPPVVSGNATLAAAFARAFPGP